MVEGATFSCATGMPLTDHPSCERRVSEFQLGQNQLSQTCSATVQRQEGRPNHDIYAAQCRTPNKGEAISHTLVHTQRTVWPSVTHEAAAEYSAGFQIYYARQGYNCTASVEPDPVNDPQDRELTNRYHVRMVSSCTTTADGSVGTVQLAYAAESVWHKAYPERFDEIGPILSRREEMMSSQLKNPSCVRGPIIKIDEDDTRQYTICSGNPKTEEQLEIQNRLGQIDKAAETNMAVLKVTVKSLWQAISDLF